MATTSFSTKIDYERIGKDLEEQELDSAGCVASGQIYTQLMAVYLLQHDLTNAKFLWKRIPQSVKSSTMELGNMWTVGQKMWQRDFPEVYKSLTKEWPDYLKPFVESLYQATQQRAFNLVMQAYSSITAEDFATFVGMPVKEAAEAATARGWQVDRQTRLILPKKMEKPAEIVVPSEEQLARLANFVSFLEN